MKKSIVLLLMIVLMLALLTACGCEHEWAEPDCDSPKTCNLCGETEGAPLGHSWLAATCAKAKHCENCSAVEGEPLPHTWVEATCTTAKTCSVCQATEGEPIAHTWEEATCESAKTCTVCDAVVGEALGHDWQDATCQKAKTCATCGKTEGELGEHNWAAATEDTPKTCTVCGATTGNVLGAADLGVTATYFLDLADKTLDVYEMSLVYVMDDEDGAVWYELVDEDEQSMNVYLFYTLAADGKTLYEVTVYTEDATQGQNGYWAGVLGGCAMVIVDPSLTGDELESMTSEIDFTEDGIDYYILEKNGILNIMAANETTYEIFFVVTPSEE